MTLIIYHLKACDTCRKAIKTLQASGHEIHLVDVRADGIPESILSNLVEKVGWETLLNTRSTTWRGLSEVEKSGIDSKKAIALLLEHPTLMKRPVIVNDAAVTVGWKADIQALY